MVNSIELEPFDAANVARFASLMLDDNPLHRLDAKADANEVIVPGALLSLLAEQAVARLRPQQTLVQMNLLFARPVSADAALAFALRDGPHVHLGGRAAKRLRLTGSSNGRICLVADCVLVDGD